MPRSKLREALPAPTRREQWRQQLHGLGLKVMIDPPPLPARRPRRADGGAPRPRPPHGPWGGRQPHGFGLDFQGRIGRRPTWKAACCIFIVAGILVPASLTLSAERWGGPTMALALGLTLLLSGLRAEGPPGCAATTSG